MPDDLQLDHAILAADHGANFMSGSLTMVDLISGQLQTGRHVRRGHTGQGLLALQDGGDGQQAEPREAAPR